MADVAGFRNTSVRYLDFHNVSDAAAEIMMLPAVLRFAEPCFGEQVAAMQALLFENGTQQADYQDFAFVHSLRPACLMGAWVALEDARMDAGPLFYWNGSHAAVRKYVFDDGSVLAEGDGPHVRAFERYLGEACREQDLERLIFTPRKGDLLIWHSALVHGGMPRNNPALTRKSMVSHYSTLEAYPMTGVTPTQRHSRLRAMAAFTMGCAVMATSKVAIRWSHRITNPPDAKHAAADFGFLPWRICHACSPLRCCARSLGFVDSGGLRRFCAG